MRHSSWKTIFITMLLLGVLMFSAESFAASASYVGITFLVEGSSEYCSITRFGEGFSLSEADALYAVLARNITDSRTLKWSQSVLPSENLTDGITPEIMLAEIAGNGTGACLINNQPVDQIFYMDIYKCAYLNTDHTCMDFYVHSGSTDLSAFGIPYNTLAEFSAVAVAEPVWDAGASKMLSFPPQSPQTIARIGLLMKQTLRSLKNDKTVKKILQNGKSKKRGAGLVSKQ
jgi:hypothetical protein